MTDNYFQEFFYSGQVARWLIDYTALFYECEKVRQLELSDLDAYLTAEKDLLEMGASLLQSVVANTSLLELFEVENAETFQRLFPDLFVLKTTDIMREVTAYLFREESYVVFETQLRRKNGQVADYSVYLDVLPVDEQKVAMLSFVEVTEQKQVIAQLQESMEKYRMLITAANDAIVLIDCQSKKIQEVNPQAEALFEKTEQELIGCNHTSLYPEQERNFYLRFYEQQLSNQATSSGIDTVILGKDNVLVPVQVNIASTEIGERNIAQVVFHDLRKRIKLEERRRLLSTAVEQAAESIMITDLSGKIEYVNPAFEKTSGYDFTEVIGRSPRMLRSATETSKMQSNLMWKEITKGNIWRGTFTNRKKGGELYQEEASITPVKDRDGSIRHYVTVKRDITQQLTLENQVRQSQKMQAIGTLAGGVAHDFNNILTAILGYAELCQTQCDEQTVLHDNLSEIIRGAERAGKLINQILQFSRKTEKEVSTLQIDLIVKEVLKLLRASLPANIEINTQLEKEVMVKADPTQMHQVILNLCTNAFQELEKTGGEITVGLQTVELTPQQGLEIGNLSPGQYVCLSVEDNGKGIPKEYLSRIFEPYFTTKSKNEGTGLGLSVVHGIVNDHRGAVQVESTVGEGARFEMYLPVAHPDEEIAGECISDTLFQGGRILVVDDEPQIVSLQYQMLEHVGYEVVASTVSSEALELFRKESETFDLVVTDMGMPGLTGLELFEEMRNIRPDIKVLLCTGYSKQVTEENAMEIGLSGYLAKPFNAEDLAAEVSRILEFDDFVD